MRIHNQQRWGFILVTFVVLACIVSCANVGMPDGGRYDDTPPVVVGCRPAMGSVGVTKKKMSVMFDEFVKLVGANEKVIVSPPQMEAANIRADGKQVRITLYDSLQANTTYTIDFGDAIEDNNEGNPMGFFTYTFSTGSTIDSMEVSGTVINAEDQEPVKGMLVGLHRADTLWNDSLFLSKPFMRVSRTNSKGQFCIKGVASGRYRIFGLMDTNGDYRYSQPTEIIAFDTTLIVPRSVIETRQDTTWHDSIHYDSIATVMVVRYLPDDIVLKAFSAATTEHHLLKTERPGPDWFRLYFTSPQDTLPRIKGLNFDENRLWLEANPGCDTLTYWIPDTAFTHSTDTLNMVLTYLDTDTAGIVVWREDTLPSLVARKGWAKVRAERQRQIDEWQKKYERQRRRSKVPLPPETNPYLVEHLEVRIHPSGTMDANRNVSIGAAEPIQRLDTAMVHLYQKKDSTLMPEPFVIYPEINGKDYTLYAEWKPDCQYSILVDSAAMVSIMGRSNKKLSADLRIRSMDEYGSLFVNILPRDTNVVVELLQKSDKVAARQRTGTDGTAEFFFLRPDTYYMRCYIDANHNGKWDTGNYQQGRQPEEVFYFPKPMVVRALWDTEQDWDLGSIPILGQKPQELRKQKSEDEKTPRNRNAERDAEKARQKNAK